MTVWRPSTPLSFVFSILRLSKGSVAPLILLTVTLPPNPAASMTACRTSTF
ncbi:hypothetical protein Hanom_Chr01g00075221 [Helianthus anomalus]